MYVYRSHERMQRGSEPWIPTISPVSQWCMDPMQGLLEYPGSINASDIYHAWYLQHYTCLYKSIDNMGANTST